MNRKVLWYKKLPWYEEFCTLLGEKKQNEDDLRSRNKILFEVEELKKRFIAVGADWSKNHWFSYQDFQKELQVQREKEVTDVIRKSIDIASVIECAVNNDTEASKMALYELGLDENHRYYDLVQNVLLYRYIKEIGSSVRDVAYVFYKVDLISHEVNVSRNKFIYYECLVDYVEKYIGAQLQSKDEQIDKIYGEIKKCLNKYYLDKDRNRKLPCDLIKAAKRCIAIINQRNK